MTEPQINEVCELMKQTIAEELGLRCGHRIKGKKVYSQPGYQDPGKHDFFVDFLCSANVKARLFIKDNTSYACVYGNGFRGEGGTRAKISAREREVAGLEIEKFKVSSSNPKLKTPEKDMAVWCGFHHRGGENWYVNRQQVIATIKDFLKWLTVVVACPEHKQSISKKGVAMLPSNTENKWEGWVEYRAYWDGFVQGWFNAKKTNELALPDDKLTLQFGDFFATDLQVEQGQLSRDEIPEPYYGTPWGMERIDAVTIHLNPGGCQDGEESKCFSHMKDGTGWLVKRFAEKHECVYSRYQAAESPLSENNINRKLEICGVPWWLTKQNELGWIQQVLGDSSIRGQRLFATELCPYHSKQCGSKLERMIVRYLVEHLFKRVFFPAAIAAFMARHQMVVCRGALIASILEKYGLTPLKEWSRKAGTPNFPHSLARYRLYQVDGTCNAFTCLNSQLPPKWRVYFLVYSKQDYSFAHPDSSYKTIEDCIRQSINYKFDALS